MAGSEKNENGSGFGKELMKSRGSLLSIFSFLDLSEWLRLQQVSRRIHDDIVPFIMFDQGRFPQLVKMFPMIVDFCSNFTRGYSDTVYNKLRAVNSLPYDYLEWPQHRMGLKDFEQYREEEESSSKDYWIKDGSMSGFGRMQEFSLDDDDKRGAHERTVYGWIRLNQSKMEVSMEQPFIEFDGDEIEIHPSNSKAKSLNDSKFSIYLFSDGKRYKGAMPGEGHMLMPNGNEIQGQFQDFNYCTSGTLHPIEAFGTIVTVKS